MTWLTVGDNAIKNINIIERGKDYAYAKTVWVVSKINVYEWLVSVQECCIHLWKLSPFSVELVVVLLDVPSFKHYWGLCHNLQWLHVLPAQKHPHHHFWEHANAACTLGRLEDPLSTGWRSINVPSGKMMWLLLPFECWCHQHVQKPCKEIQEAELAGEGPIWEGK